MKPNLTENKTFEGINKNLNLNAGRRNVLFRRNQLNFEIHTFNSEFGNLYLSNGFQIIMRFLSCKPQRSINRKSSFCLPSINKQEFNFSLSNLFEIIHGLTELSSLNNSRNIVLQLLLLLFAKKKGIEKFFTRCNLCISENLSFCCYNSFFVLLFSQFNWAYVQIQVFPTDFKLREYLWLSIQNKPMCWCIDNCPM